MEDVRTPEHRFNGRLMNRWFGHIFSLNIALLVSWVVGIRVYFENLKTSDRLEVLKPVTNFWERCPKPIPRGWYSNEELLRQPALVVLSYFLF